MRLLVLVPVTVLLACARDSAAPADGTLDLGALLGGADALHTRAVEPRDFTFPQDHGPHPAFRSEWWYFTGNLSADDGREIGYQLTFFRSALADSASFAAQSAAGARSDWRARHAWMAHFAVTDAGAGTFRAAEKFARGAIGLASAAAEPLRVSLDDWSIESVAADGTFPVRLRASMPDIAIELLLESGKPIVLQWERGLSRKGAEPGNASYYYSLTRMPTRGTVRLPAGTFRVTGTSWLDREWSTSALSAGVVGWDWLALQLSDSTELMVYRLRRADGTADPFSAATFVAPDGSARTLSAAEFRMTPGDTWRADDGVVYPTSWRVEVPALDLALDVAAAVRDQELKLAVRYWEGMVRARGGRGGRAITGRGYLEMTGYAGRPERAR
jgi:predicted secreted hydrolase